MLRSIIPRICCSIDKLIIKSSYCTRPAPTFADLNKVKLVGTLVSDSFDLSERGKVIRMITRISGIKNQRQDVIYNGLNDYAVGDRMILMGHLKTKPIEIESGKRRNSIFVVAHRMFKLEKPQDSDDSSSSSDLNILNDVNRVEVSGNVVKDIYETEDFILLNIATHYNQVFAGVRMTDYHCIQIFDEELREFVKSHIKMRDRILIEGMLDHQKSIASDGTNKLSGFIVAKNVWKISHRSPKKNITTNEFE